MINPANKTRLILDVQARDLQVIYGWLLSNRWGLSQMRPRRKDAGPMLLREYMDRVAVEDIDDVDGARGSVNRLLDSLAAALRLEPGEEPSSREFGLQQLIWGTPDLLRTTVKWLVDAAWHFGLVAEADFEGESMVTVRPPKHSWEKAVRFFARSSITLETCASANSPWHLMYKKHCYHYDREDLSDLATRLCGFEPGPEVTGVAYDPFGPDAVGDDSAYDDEEDDSDDL